MAEHTSQDRQMRNRLVQRILTSRQFAHADKLKRILLYLVAKAGEEGDSPKEYTIAVEAMGRPPSFDPRMDPIVRVSFASIRKRLEAYFSTEGRDERLRLEIPKGQYRVVFVDRRAEQQERAAAPEAIRRFWQPYLNPNALNVIVYTEPLFFRNDSGLYLRDWYVNDAQTGVETIRRRYPGAQWENLSPSFHYLSAGEMHCMLSLSRLFHELNVPVETRNSRISSWTELQRANLVLLGSPRTNSFLDSMQQSSGFRVRSDCIENLRPLDTEQAVYAGRRYRDGDLSRMTEYALVSRRLCRESGSAVTIIAANHGRAIEGAGHLLTLEDRVAALLRRMRLGPASPVPECFQLLMQVETIDVDDEVVDVECIAHRVDPR